MTAGFAPGVAGPHLVQVAFVVDDVAAAARCWVESTGIGPFFLMPHVALTEYNYRGEACDGLDFSVAMAQSGGIQIELIQQHCDSPSAYRDTIAKGAQGFHHLAIYCDDYDATCAAYRARGFATAVDGKFGTMRFCYVDTSATLGCMIELVERSDSYAELARRIAAAAADWDGTTDPLRTA